MKKWYLLAALAALTACSDGQKKVGSVYYAFTAKTDYVALLNALLGPCPGDAFCQTVLLREGAKVPTFPVRSIDDIIGIYVYDQPRFNQERLVYQWNCARLPADEAEAHKKECLTVERANELLAPYVKK